MENKKLCSKCKKYWHPVKFDMCFNCHSQQPARITQFDKHATWLDNQFEAKGSC